MTTPIEALPCPFCGHVGLDFAEGSTFRWLAYSCADAIAEWNTRTPAAEWKAAERARHKEAGRVAVTVHIWPEDREHLTRYVKRLNERRQRARDA